MLRIATVAALILVCGCERASDKPEPKPKPNTPDTSKTEHAIRLFDGETTFGFATIGTAWEVKDEVLQTSEAGETTLLTRVPFADFELTGEFELSANAVASLRIRSRSRVNDPKQDCYEIALAHPKHSTGKLVARDDEQQSAKPLVGKFTLHVSANGPNVAVKIDGKQISETSDADGRGIGLIALAKSAGTLRCHKLEVTPLGSEPIAKWNEVPGGEAKITHKSGEIHLTGGPGYLASGETFDNFILQGKVRLTKGTNSGIFFRTIEPTTEAPANGYECQLFNGIVDGDPAKPADNQKGTGAIFRRGPAARKVNAKDGEWFDVTIIAYKRNIATWVNGLQVVSWTDPAQPDENPRRGYREAAGHFVLQAHDKATNAQFRDFRVVPLR